MTSMISPRNHLNRGFTSSAGPISRLIPALSASEWNTSSTTLQTVRQISQMENNEVSQPMKFHLYMDHRDCMKCPHMIMHSGRWKVKGFLLGEVGCVEMFNHANCLHPFSWAMRRLRQQYRERPPPQDPSNKTKPENKQKSLISIYLVSFDIQMLSRRILLLTSGETGRLKAQSHSVCIWFLSTGTNTLLHIYVSSPTPPGSRHSPIVSDPSCVLYSHISKFHIIPSCHLAALSPL